MAFKTSPLSVYASVYFCLLPPSSIVFQISPHLLSSVRSSQRSLSFRIVFDNGPYYWSLCSLCSAHNSLPTEISFVMLGRCKRSWSFRLCLFHHFPVRSFMRGPKIFLGTFLSKTSDLFSSVFLRGHGSEPHSTITGCANVVYIWTKKCVDIALVLIVQCSETVVVAILPFSSLMLMSVFVSLS